MFKRNRPDTLSPGKRRDDRKMVQAWVIPVLSVTAAALSACNKPVEESAPDIRPVRTVTVAQQAASEAMTVTGHIEAENEAALGFRISGRVIERLVNVGGGVTAGQLLAKLDPRDEQNTLRSAQAGLSAAQGQLTLARNNFERQKRLLSRGVVSRADYDQAQQQLQTAQAADDDAEAQVKLAADRLHFTELKADAPGTVTATGATAGEVVQTGQMIVKIARQEGRDAVFGMPAQLLALAPTDSEVTVHLVDDPSVTASGRVREVGEQADPTTRTFQVKVGLTDPPASMRLGSTVNGNIQLNSAPVITIPASALTRTNDQAAVWVVDPSKLTVSLRNIEVSRYDPGSVVVGQGLEVGDIVVTAGVQALHPDEKVRLLTPKP